MAKTLANKKINYIDSPKKIKFFHRGNTIKHLTTQKKGSIIDPVKNHKRKDYKMGKDKKQKSKAKSIAKALVWALFAAHQAFGAWLVITNFDNYVAVLVAVTGFGLAVVSVGIVGSILGKTFSK